jgi:hypothetical protein
METMYPFLGRDDVRYPRELLPEAAKRLQAAGGDRQGKISTTYNRLEQGHSTSPAAVQRAALSFIYLVH